MFLGKYHFEAGKILIDSLLIGSILYNIEVSYNLTKANIKSLEQVHECALRMLLGLPKTSPRKMIYLLLGAVPLSHIIRKRRVNYLHHILSRNDYPLIKQFFIAQNCNKNKNDWA